MGRTGEELGVECAELYEAAQLVLKPLGADFRQAAERVARTEEGEHNFWRDSRLNGPYGPVRPAWAELRDEVSKILRQTAESLELTGDALILAANEYAASDYRAKQTFDRLKPRLDEGRGPGGEAPR